MKVLVKRFGKLINCESGAVLILVSLGMVVILGMGVIAIDVGSLYQNRRQVVNAADSSALAGVQEIVRAHQDGVTSDAGVRERVTGVVEDYLGYHGADLIEVTEQDGSPIGANSKTVKVIAEKEAKLFFAQAFYGLLGSQSPGSDVGAAAIAELKAVNKPDRVAPFAIHEDLWKYIKEEELDKFIIYMEFQAGQEQSEPGDDDYSPWGDGNWGTVNFEGPGSNMNKLRDWLENGFHCVSASDNSTIWAAPSVSLSSVLHIINELIDAETELYVPVVSGAPSGTGQLKILGFASIKLIKPYPKQGAQIEIWAEIIDRDFIVDSSPNDIALNFGLESASLIE